jgi:hypothetical protein
MTIKPDDQDLNPTCLKVKLSEEDKTLLQQGAERLGVTKEEYISIGLRIIKTVADIGKFQ